MQKPIVFLTILLLTVVSAMAQPVRVAVAANAQHVAQQLKSAFSKKTGIRVEIISGSSGKLCTQIINAAPYDIFLSADMDFANKVYEAGYALTKPRIYATGSLIVCSATGADLSNWKKTILQPSTGKIAIAHPKFAPYGRAATEALKKSGIYQSIIPRLVFGESIGQVNTYVIKKVVQIAFTTEAVIYELPLNSGFTWRRVEPSAYAAIEQGAVLLKHAKNSNFQDNKRFYDYLFTAEAKAIFKKFGYGTL